MSSGGAMHRLGLVFLLPLLAGLCVALTLFLPAHPQLVLGSLLSLAYLVLVFTHNDVALGLMIVSLPFVRVFVSDTQGLMISVPDLTMILYCGGTLLIHVFKGKMPLDRRYPALLLLFVLLSAISLGQSTNLRNSLAAFLRFMLMMMLFVEVAASIASLKKARWLILCYLMSTVLAVGIGAGDFARVSSSTFYRLGGGVGNPNILSSYLGTGMIVALYYLVQGSRPAWRSLALLALVFASISLVFTYSRWGWVSAIVAVIYWLIVNRVGVLKIATMLAVTLFLFVADNTLVRLLTRRALVDQSTRNRLVTYESGLRAIVDHPWMGIGFDQFDSLYEYMWLPDGAYKRSSHNIYIQVGVEVGLLGLVIFVACLLGITIGLIRSVRRAELSAADRAFAYTVSALLVQQLISGLSDSKLLAPYFWFVFALAAGLSIVLQQQHTPAAAAVPRHRAGSPGPGRQADRPGSAPVVRSSPPPAPDEDALNGAAPGKVQVAQASGANG